jgi:hypothetical protein
VGFICTNIATAVVVQRYSSDARFASERPM